MRPDGQEILDAARVSMQPLPIDPHLPDIASRLREAGALVLVGPPGSGKTTRVPPAILERGLRSPGRILVLEPRRIAARAAASRIAFERGWRLGDEVGYTVRFEDRSGSRTRIQVLTEGIFTRILQDRPFLDGIAAVVIDEFHERSIHADLALALVREVKRAGRDDLLLLVMSATIDPEPVARFLDDCPVVRAEGRLHPVEVRYLPRPDRSEVPELAARVLLEAWPSARGHALVFLPGIGEIRRAERELEGFARSSGADVLALHGGLDLEEQDRALRPSNVRKIVLATNIAETSITIDGVDLVVDGGLARVLRNDPRHGIDRLEVTRISRQSADQRAGRAGRTGPGVALRLWTLAEHAALAEREEPEVRRVDLAATVLELRAWGVSDPSRFEWLEAPESRALSRAEDLLLDLGAIAERSGPLTGTGQAMLRIPVHPRLSRMLIEAHRLGVLEEGGALAALIEERDLIPLSARAHPGGEAFPGRVGGDSERGPSDLLLRLDLLEEAERRGFRRDSVPGVDMAAARSVSRARDALLRSARQALGPTRKPRAGARAADAEAALLRVLLLGFPDRVARRRAKGSLRALLLGGRGAALSPSSVVRDEEFFLAIDLDDASRGERAEARVHVASAVRREWIEEDLAPFISERVETRFDPESEKVRSTATLSYRDLPLEEPRERRPPPGEADRILEAAARERAEEIFRSDEEAAEWLVRARCLGEWLPELDLPEFDAAELGDALAPACAGKTSLAEVRAAGLLGLLLARLPHQKAVAVEKHAPPAITVPSGRSHRLEYQPGRPPVLAVRLQEMFGLAETPTVARGRVPVLLHLLGPNHRPVQITQDLKSFWNTTYAQVRKDLRARYPKHSWPEDPWSAAPTARARRRGEG
jgi:ATP-dependent RNA helicase HrpB